MTRTTAVGVALLVLVACSSFATTSRGLKQKLVGITGLDLRQCIGVPTDTSTDGASEFLTYRFAVEDEKPLLADAEDRVERHRPRGAVDGVPTGIDPDDPNDPSPEEELRLHRPGKPKFGYCELVFELRDGGVHAVEVEGRSSDGLNRDIECLSRTRRCIPRAKPQG